MPALNRLQRQQEIRRILNEDGSVRLPDLAERFGVSSMTVRRDLKKMEQQGILVLHRGIAVRESTAFEPPYTIRQTKHAEAKRRIAEAAARLVEPNQVVALDVGSTVLETASQLNWREDITIITHWVPNLMVLARGRGSTVVCLGGILRRDELSLNGTLAQEILAQFNVDVAFIGVAGIHAERGFTDYRWDEIEVKRAVMKRARQTVIVADSSKFGVVAPIRIAGLQEADIIVTEAAPDSTTARALAAAGVQVVLPHAAEAHA